MKKRFLIACLALVLAGGLAFVVGMSALGWNFALLDSEVYEAKTFELESSPESLSLVSVDVRNAEIKIVTGSEIKIEYEESDRLKYSVVYDEEAKSLVMEEIYSVPKIFGMFNFHNQVITITVPKVDKLNLESTNGKIEVPSGVYDEIDIETTNGVVEINDVIAVRGVEVSTTNSRITLSNIRAERGKIEAHSTNGVIVFSDITANSAEGKTTNGQITASDVETAKLSLITTNGPVVCNRIDIEESAFFKSTNGNITASFVGSMSDFTVEGYTTNGDIYPGNVVGGSKRIECHSTNGDIRLTFERGEHENDHE